MKPKPVLFLFGLTLSVMSLACDRICSHTVEDVATIQNMTGRSLSITFCKGQVYGLAPVTIGQESLVHEVSLGTRQEKVARGGPTNSSCSDLSDEKRPISIALAPNSFGKVKLCHDSAGDQYVLMETSQSCPSGFAEQTSAEPCRETAN